ncbi:MULTISPECIES: Rcs stress response system protein RcsF [Aliagarivorans]|uniref:Rcs stress response system protein RcsF n=1 Tax=Aliagarivorans TaxID=882379 RepID=UPI00042099E1|nr:MULTISPECIES: Rcs stress response system protein RcsF [Aliagarivorans]
MKYLAFVIMTLGLSACSGGYSFNTNLDRENFENYVPASRVQVLEDGQFDELNSEYLGVVEGIACQESSNDMPPQLVDARNDAREQASLIGANTIVIQQCYPVTDPVGCEAMLSCFARAFSVPQE